MHTFLFREGIWRHAGQVVNEDGTIVRADGESRVTHHAERWQHVASMRLPDGKNAISTYEITPFAADARTTLWVSDNPTLGRMLGRYALVDDSILSMFVSDNSEFSGTEYLLKVTDDLYRNRGCLYRGDTLISQWIVELTSVLSAV